MNPHSPVISVVALTVLFAAYNQLSSRFCTTKINVYKSDDSIRKDLFNYTPRGSQADDVLEFVLSRLYHEANCFSGVGIVPAPSIEAQLGHSLGFISHKVTEAEWVFDERLTLKDIRITRHIGKTGGEDCDTRLRVDLHKSDAEIRNELLKYVPLGSNIGAPHDFIGMRLFFRGGPCSYGEALTGKPGTGAILGHYFDEASGVEKSVRVNWVHGKQNKVCDLEVRRVDGVAPLFPSWPKIK